MTFGDVLKAVRADIGITQEQLARELSVSFSTLNRWENGHTRPSRLARIRLLEFCGQRHVSQVRIAQLKSCDNPYHVCASCPRGE